MVYRTEFEGMPLSALGFGTMRLPLIPGGGSGDIDCARVDEMVDYALSHGVKYFDTAYPYHESRSETVIGESLSRYPRESYCLADKFPGHQIMKTYDMAGIFADQLQKCRTEYFDFYLMHNVNEQSIENYLNPEFGIVDWFIEQKRLGKIKHIGFSCHGDVACMQRFLDAFGSEMEFCQIQLNYLDWTLQDAKAKYEFLTEKGLGVWVMEPVRGGKLDDLGEKSNSLLKALRPAESIPAWAFRFLQGLPNVRMILSGMSSLEQMKDNVSTFEERLPLNEELSVLMACAEEKKNAVPCTGCRYCCDGCPMELNIPKLIALYNDLQVHSSINISIALESMGPGAMPGNCIGCGRCEKICPQGIKVPELMHRMDEAFSALPSWTEICAEREAARLKQKENGTL